MSDAHGPETSVGRRALVTGISGQDGSFLAELLLDRGYHVTGLVRRQAGESLGAAEPLRERLTLLRADLLDREPLRRAVLNAAPQELYHFAAPSFVPDSWEHPGETFAAVAGATGVILGAALELHPHPRVYVASSAAMFGDAGVSPQREDTACRPTNPYAVAKLASHQLVGVMRARHGLHASSGITFNHESERRPPRFVTRKVTRAAAAASLGLDAELVLGDLDAVRDWSFAGDIVRAAWLMLQQPDPGDFVLASGIARSVRELVSVAFSCVGLEAEPFLRIDPRLVRAPEATPSVGDPTRARERLAWCAELTFEELIARMVRADQSRLRGRPGPP